jgi:hypothetical protein
MEILDEKFGLFKQQQVTPKRKAPFAVRANGAGVLLPG